MSYNIDTFKLKKIENFKMPYGEVEWVGIEIQYTGVIFYEKERFNELCVY